MTSLESQQRALTRIDRDECLQLEKSLTREWLETNGRGGYASSTALLCPTRRYHGLLVLPPEGSVKRHVFLSRFEETLASTDKTFPLSMARYAGTWSPPGHQSIDSFELVPWPSWIYRVGAASVRREVLMVQGEPTVLCRYSARDLAAVELRLRPLLACREADDLTFENLALDARVQHLPNGVVSRPYASLPPVAITAGGAAARFDADPVWYRGLEYRVDLERGYGGHEDQFSPGTLRTALIDGADVVVAATTGAPVADPVALWRRESAARLLAAEHHDGSVRSTLALFADAFLYRSPTGRLGVVAGFPWFGEWGRDTFVSLPGLLLSRGRTEDCGEALEAALAYLKDGLLPNVFGTGRGDSHYGSADASLWLARAVRLYEVAGGSRLRVVQRLRPGLAAIAAAYEAGTSLGIRVDADGQLRAGDATTNATWMDARTEAGPVTPRHGCAVELAALWYFLLAYLAHLADLAGDHVDQQRWLQRAKRAGRAFLDRFWLPDRRYLADLWRDGVADPTVRPNMVLAAALELSPLSKQQRAGVVEIAAAELLTPRGLRTLAPGHAGYAGRYRGNQAERDAAYHQGTVWPWLLGSYCEAHIRAHGLGAAQEAHLRPLLDGFAEHLWTQGLGHVSEVFDGDPPHRPGGTIAQAWSTAELLRAYSLLESFPS